MKGLTVLSLLALAVVSLASLMLTVLRWLCVPPAALAAWYLALILALLLHTAVEGFCPPDQVVSGACFAPWFLRFSDVLVCFGAALAASLIVLAAFLVAPSHRFHVACTQLVPFCESDLLLVQFRIL